MRNLVSVKFIHFMLIVGISVLLTVNSANAAVPDFYVGGAIGKSTIREDNPAIGNFSDSENSWAIRAGMKPLPILGAEIEYADFGKANVHTTGLQASDINVSVRASSLFAMLYIPNPIPKFYIIAKVGYANESRQTNGTLTTTLPGVGACPISNPNCGTTTSTVDVNETSQHVAYGAAVQLNLFHILLRADYQRINSPRGDPDMATIGVAWKF